MEGSLRQAGTKLRLAVQLVDATTGAHRWAETYERSFGPDGVFELHEELVPRIVSIVADMNGARPRSMSVLDALASQSNPGICLRRWEFMWYSALGKMVLKTARLLVFRETRAEPEHIRENRD